MGFSDLVLLVCFVHPIDTAAHPTVPAGFRWAASTGPNPADLSRIANAGWCPTAAEAEAEGDQNAATATRALQLCGVEARYGGVHHLTYDPVPAGTDAVNTA